MYMCILFRDFISSFMFLLSLVPCSWVCDNCPSEGGVYSDKCRRQHKAICISTTKAKKSFEVNWIAAHCYFIYFSMFVGGGRRRVEGYSN
jgi:predicted metal-binding protein